MVLIALIVALVAEEPGLRILYEDSPAPPWVLPDGTGLDLDLLRGACRQLEVELELECLPWKRCLKMIEQGKADGLSSASFNRERAAFARYPRTAGGAVDAGRRLHVDSYALYRRRGDALDFDGERLIGLEGALAAQSGFSIIARLDDLGAPVDDSSKHIKPILERLAAGRVEGAALLTSAAGAWLADHPEDSQRFERVPTLLVEKPYYLIFSDDCYRRHPELCERIWTAMAELRRGDEHRARLRGAGIEEP